MAKHKHAEMIKAKADNMDLVVLVRTAYGGDWFEIDNGKDLPSFRHDNEYFLCLPKHKDAVLNVLNGGRSQANFGKRWSECNCNEPTNWSDTWWYMDAKCESRIKPRKENRYVVLHKGKLVNELFEFDADIRASYGAEYNQLQIFEIEAEV